MVLDKAQSTGYNVRRRPDATSLTGPSWTGRNEEDRTQRGGPEMEGRPETMKLAEALAERKALQEQINDLTGRMRANALVQEGDTPSERPEELRAQLEQRVERLGALIKA